MILPRSSGSGPRSTGCSPRSARRPSTFPATTMSSNPLQQKVWQERYGPTYSHFRRADALFCLLDTQDPPADYAEPTVMDDLDHAEWVDPPPRPDRSRATAGLERHPAGGRRVRSNSTIGRTCSAITGTPDGRSCACTCRSGRAGIRPGCGCAACSVSVPTARSPATSTTTGTHSIDGRSHIRLGPTGGLWVLGGPEGNFDHVTQVTLTDDGTGAGQHPAGGRPRHRRPAAEPGGHPLRAHLLSHRRRGRGEARRQQTRNTMTS